MSHLGSNFGIVTEGSQDRISIFDADTLTVLHQIPLGIDAIDVVITPDCSRAVVISFGDKTLVQLDLQQETPIIIDTQVATFSLEDVDITPNGDFAVMVDGEGNDFIQSYDLQNKIFVSILPTSAQAVAVSPNGNGLVLTGKVSTDMVRRFTIDNAGVLSDTGFEITSGGDNPINITFTPDGNFAFVSNFSDTNIGILNTQNPNNILLANVHDIINSPQTIVVSKDGTKVFVLTDATVEVFNFNPILATLTLVTSFAHGLSIISYYGVDQMALDITGTQLFISAGRSGVLATFKTDGTPLGNVPGIVANGGVAICGPPPTPSRGINFF